MRIILTLLFLAVLALSLTLSLDESAMNLHDESFERAMIAFGLAKGLNAIISLIQGTQLSLTPVGVGMTFSVGEVLDPLNDMVERFSWVMLGATVSLGIQKIVLILSTKLFLQVALFLSVGTVLFFMWMKKLKTHGFFILSIRIVLFLFILRFGAIAFVYSSELFYNSILQTEFATSSAVLEKTKDKLEEMQSKNNKIVESKKDSAWYELDVRTKYEELKSQLNIQQQLKSLEESMESASRKIINLITIFVVQSILMPLLFLWLLFASIRWIFRMEMDAEHIFRMLNKTQKSSRI
ncbi:hypothetical protein KKG72_09535 [bacterium]|nr:hypothetical protein [bacterium]MBU1993126.1 hypothetical protein [bacterium]